MASPHATEAATDCCRILDLPAEIILLIIPACSIASLQNLALTCRAVYERLATPLKYAVIDVSAHNLGRFLFTHPDGAISSYCSDRYPPKFDVDDLARRQHRFIATLLENQILGTYIRKFTWTIRSNCHYIGSVPNHLSPKAVYPDTRLWSAFQILTNVTDLDLGCYHENWSWEYLQNPPATLFPSVTKLRLSGLMYPQIAENILRSVSLSSLTRLSLDNLQNPGHRHGIYPYKKYASDPRRGLIESADLSFPGTMRGILPLIEGECTSLLSFTYRKPGGVIPSGGWSAASDRKACTELASFLSSVRLTLQEFHFEQGVPEAWIIPLREMNGSYPPGCPPLVTSTRGIHLRFVRYVWPVLVSQDWPRLKMLSLRGVGAWKGVKTISTTKKRTLSDHLGDGVRIIYEDVAERACEEFQGEQ